MERQHLFEIHDFPWCPPAVRNGLTDFLQFWNDFLDMYAPVRPMLADAARRCGSQHVVDMCSGAGGPWVKWVQGGTVDLSVTLTDRYPNTEAARRIETLGTNVVYHRTPVDATRVPADLDGFRTVFTAFHHFTPEQGRAILHDAVSQHRGIAVLECTDRSLMKTAGMLLTPLGPLVFAPRIRPLRASALALTYVLPLIPLVAGIDGVLSCLRSYSSDDLRTLAGDCDTTASFEWQSGVEKGITYLIGCPK